MSNASKYQPLARIQTTSTNQFMGQKTDAETKNDTLSSYKIFNLVDTLIQQVSDNIIKLVGE